MDELQHKIDLADALKRLFDNKDFKLVIQEDFLKEYVLQLVQMNSTQSAFLNPDFKKYIESRINAVGVLQTYFQAVIAEGESAKNTLNEGVPND